MQIIVIFFGDYLNCQVDDKAVGPYEPTEEECREKSKAKYSLLSISISS